jgi:hypothetical protein
MRLTLALAALLIAAPTQAHDIYTGIYGKGGQLCCGGNDCAVTTYRERGSEYQFLTRKNEWVTIPADRITFLPIPGDQPSSDSHYAHLCYRDLMPEDTLGPSSDHVIGDIFFYCAFIPPGSI